MEGEPHPAGLPCAGQAVGVRTAAAAGRVQAQTVAESGVEEHTGQLPEDPGATSHARIEGEASHERKRQRDHPDPQEADMARVREGEEASDQEWVRLVGRRRELEEVLPYQVREGPGKDRVEAAARNAVAGEVQEARKADERGEGRDQDLRHPEAGVHGEPVEGEEGAVARCLGEGEEGGWPGAAVRTETATRVTARWGKGT